MRDEEDRYALGARRQLAGEIRRHANVSMAKRLGWVVLGAERFSLPYKKHVAQRWDAGGVGNLEGHMLRAGLAAVAIQDGSFQNVLPRRR